MLVYIEFGSSVTVAGDAVADSRGQDPDQIVLPVAARRKESMYSEGGPYIRKVGRIQLLTRETHFFTSTNPRFDKEVHLFCVRCIRLQSSLPACRLEHPATCHFACAR